MVYTKLWLDVKTRFLWCSTLFVASALLLLCVYPELRGMMQAITFVASQERGQPVVMDFTAYVDRGWFRDQLLAAMAICLSLGGVFTELRSRTVYITLAFPVSRRRWILSQTVFTACLVGALSLVGGIVLAGASPLFAQSYPLAHALRGSLFLWLSALSWIALTIAAGCLTGDRMKAGLLMFALLLVTDTLDQLPGTRMWMPESFIQTIPAPVHWQPIFLALAVCAASLIYAVKRFERRDT